MLLLSRKLRAYRIQVAISSQSSFKALPSGAFAGCHAPAGAAGVTEAGLLAKKSLLLGTSSLASQCLQQGQSGGDGSDLVCVLQLLRGIAQQLLGRAPAQAAVGHGDAVAQLAAQGLAAFE